MRFPQSTEQLQPGHLPSTGSRWPGSDLRKCRARQIRWHTVSHDGRKQDNLSADWQETTDGYEGNTPTTPTRRLPDTSRLHVPHGGVSYADSLPVALPQLTNCHIRLVRFFAAPGQSAAWFLFDCFLYQVQHVWHGGELACSSVYQGHVMY